MKSFPLPFSLLLLTTATTLAGPAQDAVAAAKKLGEASSFAWTLTSEFGNAPAVPTHGVTEKGGYTVMTVTFNENTFTTVRKGEKAVSQGRDGAWLGAEERRAQFAGTGTPNAGGPGTGGGGVGRGGRGGIGFFGGSAAQNDLPGIAAKIATQLQDVRLVDGAITGTLSPEDASPFLIFNRGGRGGGAEPPAPKNATGSAKFWVKDGVLVKYVVTTSGRITFGDGQERDVERTLTTEFKDIGTAKAVVPEEAKKKLGD